MMSDKVASAFFPRKLPVNFQTTTWLLQNLHVHLPVKLFVGQLPRHCPLHLLQSSPAPHRRSPINDGCPDVYPGDNSPLIPQSKPFGVSCRDKKKLRLFAMKENRADEASCSSTEQEHKCHFVVCGFYAVLRGSVAALF